MENLERNEVIGSSCLESHQLFINDPHCCAMLVTASMGPGPEHLPACTGGDADEKCSLRTCWMETANWIS